MKPIITWEIKQRKVYIIGWTIGTVITVSILLLIYPSIRDQAAQLNKVLNQLPTSIRYLKTGGSQVDITTPIGYLHSQIYYLTLPLLQIIMSIGLGSSLLARDEQNHTLELLLARPVSRAKVLAAKALSGIMIILFVSTVTTIFILVLANAINLHIAISRLVITGLYAMFFALGFGAITFALCAVSNATRRAASALAIVISFGGYLLASLSGMSHYIEAPAKFLPYHYYNPNMLLEGHAANELTVYLVGIFTAAGLAAWFGFRHRDVY